MNAAGLGAALRGAVVRLHTSPFPHGPAALVAVAASREHASPAALLSADAVCALLTHDAGVTRPDAIGCAMLAEVVKRQGTALLAFQTPADAEAAASWLLALATTRGQA
jgi:hypothetical protein